MGTARVAFDPSMPVVVACSDLPCGPKRFARGDAFPWRDLGLSEIDLVQLWVALKVDCFDPVDVLQELPAHALPAAEPPKAGESIPIETPKQKRQRAAQRAE